MRAPRAVGTERRAGRDTVGQDQEDGLGMSEGEEP